MINQSQILGRIGKIDTHPMNSGSTVTNISMVTSKKYTKDGEKKEVVTWHNVTCFSKLSEIAEKYVHVGDLLYIQGEMNHQKYTGSDGIERNKSVVIAHELKLMPKAKEHKPEPKDDSFGSSHVDVPF